MNDQQARPTGGWLPRHANIRRGGGDLSPLKVRNVHGPSSRETSGHHVMMRAANVD